MGCKATFSATLLLVLSAMLLPVLAQEEGTEQSNRKLEKARAANPAWKPKYKQANVIKVPTKGGTINNFCLNQQGNLVVCVGPEANQGPTELQVISPAGKVLEKIPLKFIPQAICTDAQGCLYVAGIGKVCKLNPQGKILLEMPAPALQVPAAEQEKWKEQIKEEMVRVRKEYKEMNSGMKEAELDRLMENLSKTLATRRGHAAGIAVIGEEVFVSAPSPAEFGFMVWRLDAKLSNPARFVGRLSGCCGQMDIQGRGSQLWLAHNGKHKVECYDAQGRLVTQFGKFDRAAADGFGGCCEPKNLTFAPNGDILAAESGPPVVVKRFTPDGKFLGVLAHPTYKNGCVRVSVAMSADEKKLFLLNTGDNTIHVFTR
ncbi:MAG: hypothetical protein N3J91_13105 [Verrucomicrobiae bacterium]|nr:hypothetical protein [Verrucomicrobiae bacterium]